MRFIFFIIGICTVFLSANAQTSLSIEDCYLLARQNYPLARQRELILKSRDYSIENALKGYSPQVSIQGQATYQSEVTQIPIQVPGMDIPALSKDQYRLYGEINQVLFDGGLIKQQKQSLEVKAMVEEQKLEVELYKLKERINQLFFGILLADAQSRQIDLLKKDIQSGISKAEAAIANGTAFKSSLYLLQAELLKANQRATELDATRKAYMSMLGLFINQTLDENTTLVKPANLTVSSDIRRPELLLYDYQNRNLDVQYKMIAAKNLPRFNLFVQGGIGRPALNMLSNDIEPYAIGGIRMNWPLSGFYTRKNEKSLIDIDRSSIALQKETFLFNTNLSLQQQNAELNKLQALLSADDEIIALHTQIKNSASAQLANGVTNAHDYLRDVNAEDQARQNKILHEIQWLMAQYNQHTTTGN